MSVSLLPNRHSRRFTTGQQFRCVNIRHAAVAVTVYVLSAFSNEPPCIPRPVSDTLVVRKAGCLAGRDEKTLPEIAACLSNTSPRTLLVFRNGTQVEELDAAETEQFLARNPLFLSDEPSKTGGAEDPVASSRAAKLWGEHSLTGTLLNRTLDQKSKMRYLVSLGEWEPGVTISDQIEAAGSTTLVLRNIFQCNGMARIAFVYAGLGYQHVKFGGAMAEILLKEKKSYFRNYSFSATVGVPFLRYEIKTASWVIPEFFWLEKDMVRIIYDGEEGVILAQARLKWGKSHLDNLMHTVYVRLGHVYLQMTFDKELYRTPVVRLSLDDMPSVLGTWGASLIHAKDVVIPGVWISLPQPKIERIAIGQYRFPLRLEPLRLHFNYWDLKRYNYGVTVKAHIGYKRHTGSENEQ